MEHRNMTGQEWTRMAIDSLYSRGQLPDWQEFAESLAKDRRVAESALVIGERHEDTGSAALARILVERFHPELLAASPHLPFDQLQTPSR
jgi:hypothetical protein